MKHVKTTRFQIRQESKQEAEVLPKTKAPSSFYWESLINMPDSYVHVTLQTETDRMENVRPESYFVQVMVIPRSQNSKNQKNSTPTNQNQPTK